MKENPVQAPTNSGKVCAVKGKRNNPKGCPFDPLWKTVRNKRAETTDGKSFTHSTSKLNEWGGGAVMVADKLFVDEMQIFPTTNHQNMLTESQSFKTSTAASRAGPP